MFWKRTNKKRSILDQNIDPSVEILFWAIHVATKIHWQTLEQKNDGEKGW